MHRLTQAIIRSQLSVRQAALTGPGRGDARATSFTSGRALHNTPAPGLNGRGSSRTYLRRPRQIRERAAARAGHNAAWYLAKRGDARASYDLARPCTCTGATSRSRRAATLDAQYVLTFALSEMGRYQEARDLDKDALIRRRRVTAMTHPDAQHCQCARGAAPRPWEHRAARDLYEDTLNRARRVLGEDRPRYDRIRQ